MNQINNSDSIKVSGLKPATAYMRNRYRQYIILTST